MKIAQIQNNKIINIPDQSTIAPVWKEVADDMKCGDIYDKSIASKDERIAAAYPSADSLVDALWDAIANSNSVKLEALKAEIEAIQRKYV